MIWMKAKAAISIMPKLDRAESLTDTVSAAPEVDKESDLGQEARSMAMATATRTETAT
jgi:hypothetical protein